MDRFLQWLRAERCLLPLPTLSAAKSFAMSWWHLAWGTGGGRDISIPSMGSPSPTLASFYNTFSPPCSSTSSLLHLLLIFYIFIYAHHCFDGKASTFPPSQS